MEKKILNQSSSIRSIFCILFLTVSTLFSLASCEEGVESLNNSSTPIRTDNKPGEDIERQPGGGDSSEVIDVKPDDFEKIISLIKDGKIDKLGKEIKSGNININAKNRGDNANILHKLPSVTTHDIGLKVLELLENNGANISEMVNAKDSNGMTPLHQATLKGNEVLALKLIDKGADVNVVDKHGYTRANYMLANEFMKGTNPLLNQAYVKANKNKNYTSKSVFNLLLNNKQLITKKDA